MTEHRIRLRLAWIGEFERGDARVDLPTDWQPTPPGRPFRLRRSFRIPEVDRRRSVLELQLVNVPGLQRISLDQTILAEASGDEEEISIQLAVEFSGRVLLTLDVDPTCWKIQPGASWGEISILIRE